jgi:hypothetical protein
LLAPLIAMAEVRYIMQIENISQELFSLFLPILPPWIAQLRSKRHEPCN